MFSVCGFVSRRFKCLCMRYVDTSCNTSVLQESLIVLLQKLSQLILLGRKSPDRRRVIARKYNIFIGQVNPKRCDFDQRLKASEQCHSLSFLASWTTEETPCCCRPLQAKACRPAGLGLQHSHVLIYDREKELCSPLRVK